MDAARLLYALSQIDTSGLRALLSRDRPALLRLVPARCMPAPRLHCIAPHADRAHAELMPCRYTYTCCSDGVNLGPLYEEAREFYFSQPVVGPVCVRGRSTRFSLNLPRVPTLSHTLAGTCQWSQAPE